jgi:hypothetical protein
MSALNKNNSNGGGVGDSAISKLVPERVSVTSADHKPSNPPLGGPTFESGSPKGREANPKPKIDGGNPILT